MEFDFFQPATRGAVGAHLKIAPSNGGNQKSRQPESHQAHCGTEQPGIAAMMKGATESAGQGQ